jgi:hypothetical protein
MQSLHNSCELMNMPDEILLLIMEKLKSIDVLYSLVGVNKRLNNVVRNVISNSIITLVRTSSTDCICPLYKPDLDRFCSYVLPQMHHHITRMILECLSMKRILQAADYPNLYVLDLLQFEYNMFSNCFSGIFLTLNDTYIQQICFRKTKYATFRLFRYSFLFLNFKLLKKF